MTPIQKKISFSIVSHGQGGMILKVLHDGFGNPKYAPCPLLTNMITAGKLGAKSGEGFYVYTAGSKELIVSKSFITTK